MMSFGLSVTMGKHFV